MKLLKRIAFAIRHDIDPDYIVVPFGDNYLAISTFVNYEDAVAFTEKEHREKPMYGKPGILVRVKR